jgi:hypothetical protein
VPVQARARALRRAAQAVLDELDPLALLLARETGRPRTEALVAELLPSVSGLHALADAAPGALGDRWLGRRAVWRPGRRAALVQRPAGVVGLRGGRSSPWAEPLLEAAAALVAGNAVVLVPAARRSARARACTGTAAHSGCTRRPSAAAAWTSAAEAAGTVPSTSPVAGERSEMPSLTRRAPARHARAASARAAPARRRRARRTARPPAPRAGGAAR